MEPFDLVVSECLSEGRTIVGRLLQTTGLYVVTTLLLMLSAGCVPLPMAPIRAVPTDPPWLFIEVVEMPETACIGDLVEFSIGTTPGNDCGAGVIVYDAQTGKQNGLSFEDMTADGDGLCSWVWAVPENLSPGRASFHASVGDEITSNVMMPRFFEIGHCARP
jgi:hypothetical protein